MNTNDSTNIPTSTTADSITVDTSPTTSDSVTSDSSPAAAPEKKTSDPVEQAYNKVLSEKNSSAIQNDENSELSTEQATALGSDSTQDDDLDKTLQSSDSETSDSDTKNDSTSTPLTAPETWPKDRIKQFDALPDDAKNITLSFYKDMEKGLKQSFDKLANERKEFTNNFGYPAEKIKGLIEKAKAFDADPVSSISELAAEAGVSVFFDNKEQEIPEFESNAEMVKWLREKSQNEARQAAHDATKAIRLEEEKRQAQLALEKDFAEAHRNHPDLADHQESVIEYMTSLNVPVELAYRLSVYDGLSDMARQGLELQEKLSKVQDELDTLKKSAIVHPESSTNRTTTKKSSGNIFEDAFDRANKR